MTKARDLANASTALSAVSATELAFVDGVTSAIQTQIDAKTAKATLTTKGDVYAATAASTPARLAVGADGTTLVANSATATGLEWQTPASGALTFTQRNAQASTINSIEYNGTNLYVAVGNSGALLSSPDGLTWTSRTSGFGSNAINDVFYGNALWVAVGQAGTITTSSDGTTWTARTSNMSTNTLRGVKYANSLWVVVGGGGGATNTGGLAYSSDGITWTRKSQTLTVGTTYLTIIYNGTNWVIGASSDTNNHLYASAPSGTWTVGASGSGNQITQLFWDGTRNLELNTSDANLRYSTSLTLGATTQTNGTIRGGSYYYNSELYTGSQIGIVYSTVINANNTIIRNETFLAPTTSLNNDGSLASNWSTVFVGAAGIILSGGGVIFTSF